jgi:hypothetical protein
MMWEAQCHGGETPIARCLVPCGCETECFHSSTDTPHLLFLCRRPQCCTPQLPWSFSSPPPTPLPPKQCTSPPLQQNRDFQELVQTVCL